MIMDTLSNTRSQSLTPHGVGGLKFTNEYIIINLTCLTPHGVGGLKCIDQNVNGQGLSLTPQGVGGLKSDFAEAVKIKNMSHPTRGGWIEICRMLVINDRAGCLTPHGVGGLKYHPSAGGLGAKRVSPHTGVGGLK